MSAQIATYDVFLSYSLHDSRVADSIKQAITDAGLDVFVTSEVESGENVQDAIWHALAESAALVAIFSSEGEISSSVAVELGAFIAWHKPIYIIISVKGGVRIPSYLSRFPIFPVSRIDDVVQSIKRDLQSLSEIDQELLKSVYSDLRLSVDQIITNPASLDRFSHEFNVRSGRQISGERLVQALLRLRKAGDLPRTRG